MLEFGSHIFGGAPLKLRTSTAIAPCARMVIPECANEVLIYTLYVSWGKHFKVHEQVLEDYGVLAKNRLGSTVGLVLLCFLGAPPHSCGTNIEESEATR